MRNEPSREAVNLALELFDVAQRRTRRGENDPTSGIAVALQRLMDERDEANAQVQFTKRSDRGIVMTYADDDLRRADRLVRHLPPGTDVGPFVRLLCREFSNVRYQAFEIAALAVAEHDGNLALAHLIRELKGTS